MKKSKHFVYILLCENHAYYTGYTTDIVRRIKEHLAGTYKSKYTRSFKAVKLCQQWQLPSKSDALKAECCIKKLSHQQKAALINNPDSLVNYL